MEKTKIKCTSAAQNVHPRDENATGFLNVNVLYMVLKHLFFI